MKNIFQPFLPLKSGSLEVRLAQTLEEVEAAQKLRYRIFYEEMGAQPLDDASKQKDVDVFDTLCDHLLVLDHAHERAIVGTYRLIRREVALRYGNFYTASEYDIAILEKQQGEILELGRSCIDKAYRKGPVMYLLWQGIAAYLMVFKIDLLFGCASFSGANPEDHAQALSYLFYCHLAPSDCCPKALSDRYIAMNTICKSNLDFSQAKRQLPPLIKGYIRLGGFVGDGAVVDKQFNTTDICIILKKELVSQRYFKHYWQPQNVL